MRAILLTLFLSICLISMQAQSLGLVVTPDTVKCANDTILIEVSATLGTAPYTYLWSPSTGLGCDTCASTATFALDSATYMVVVTDSNLILDTAFVTVVVDSGGYASGDSIIDILAYFPYPDKADYLSFSVDSNVFQGGSWTVIMDFETKDDTVIFTGNSFTYYDLFDACPIPVKTELNCFANIYACFSPDNSCHIYCTDTFIGIAYVAGSIAEKNTIQVDLYPNPVHDNLAISGDVFGATEVLIYNAFGQLVLQHQAMDLVDEQVDVSALVPGIYILHIQTKNGLAVHRVVKN